MKSVADSISVEVNISAMILMLQDNFTVWTHDQGEDGRQFHVGVILLERSSWLAGLEMMQRGCEHGCV